MARAFSVFSVILLGALICACGDAGEGVSDTQAALETTSFASGSTGAMTTGASDTSAGPSETGETGETGETSETGETTGAPAECVEPAPLCAAPVCDAGAWACPCARPLEVEAGFMELEAVSYWLGHGEDESPLESSPARLFYAFFPADEDACARPLMVLFNGGPGASSLMLMTNNTAPRTVAETTGALATVVDNPDSWTGELANLLYIDTRQAGFSYAQLEDPSLSVPRSEHFSVRNFNPLLDGADIVRALLRFLAARPQLQRNPVIFVGESYGGTRATAALNLLLLPRWYDEDAEPDLGRRYRDPALAAEIMTHLEAVFPGEDPAAPGLAARQFGHQALLQPLVGGSSQFLIAGELLDLPGSPIFELADSLDMTFTPCSEQGPNCNPVTNAAGFVFEAGRSRYDLAAPYGWLDDIFARTRHAALAHDSLAALLAPVEPVSIAGLPASERGGAFRVDPGDSHPLDSEVGDLPQQLGALAGDWDRYFIPYNPGAGSSFGSFEASALGVQMGNPHFARLFLENAVYVETLITSSRRDIAIYSPAIPDALALQSDLLEAAWIDAESPAEAARPGELVLEYRAVTLAGAPAPPQRVIRFPTYDASHAVTLERSAELREDIQAWIAE